MVLSCLVEPLVSPLVGRGTSGPGRKSGLRRSRFAATALAASALMAVSTCVDVSTLREEAKAAAPEAKVVRNAHRRPDATPYRVVLAAFLGREENPLLAEPGEAPDFEHRALYVHRLRHRRDLGIDPGPVLGLGRRLDRLRPSALSAFRLFASATCRAGAPYPIHV